MKYGWIKGILVLTLGWAGAALQGCDSPQAGVSIETNSIAGILLNDSGKPVQGALVSLRNSSDISVATSSTGLKKYLVGAEWLDTTDKEGRWGLNPSVPGEYVLTAKAPDSSVVVRVLTFRDSLRLTDTTRSLVQFSARLTSRWNEDVRLLAAIPGTDYVMQFDRDGFLDSTLVPQGEWLLWIESPDPLSYADIFFWVVTQNSAPPLLYGPFHTEMMIDDIRDIVDRQKDLALLDPDSLELPLSTEYALRGWWNFDHLRIRDAVKEFVDVRGTSGNGVLYEGGLIEGVVNSALHLDNSSEFGVIEGDQQTMDSLDAMSVEMWVRLNTVGTTGVLEGNLVGKLGFLKGSADVFSIAVEQDSLGQAHWAFYLASEASEASEANDQSDSLESLPILGHRVVLPEIVPKGEWVYLTAVWTGQEICLYADLYQKACSPASRGPLGTSREAWYFGKEEMSIDLDEVKFLGIALNEVDIRYRWLRRIP